MAVDKAQKSNLQVVGEESKEVEDVTEIVDIGAFVVVAAGCCRCCLLTREST